MSFDKVEITINTGVTQTSGIALPSGAVCKVEAQNQTVALDGKSYHCYPALWANEECYVALKARVTIEGLTEVLKLDNEEGAVSVGNQDQDLYFIIDIDSSADADTNTKRKNLIIAVLAEKLSLDVSDFS